MSRTSPSPPSPISSAPPGPALSQPRAPDAQAPKPAFFRVSALARRLGITKRYLYTLIQQGDLRAVYPSPRRVLVPSDEVDRMIEKWRTRPRPDRCAAHSSQEALQ